MGVQDAVVANLRAGADDDIRVHDRARANRRAGTNRDERPDRYVGAEPRVFRDGAEPIDSGRRRRGRLEQPEGQGEREIRVIAAQDGERCGGVEHGGRSEDHRRCLCVREQRLILRVGHKREITARGLLDAGHADDLEVAVTLEPTPQTFSQIAELQRRPIRF